VVTRCCIAPSILAADFGAMANAVSQAEEAGAGAIHVDVMDGHFVPDISFGRQMVERLRLATALPLDVHLMVGNPARHIDPVVQAGASAVTVHYEAARGPDELAQLLTAIRVSGARSGVALKPATDSSVLAPVWGQVDQVLVMTVEPGYSGQAFMPEMLVKIRRVATQAASHSVTVAADGGIDERTIGRCAQAGATFFVAGSSIYSPRRTVAEGMTALQAALDVR